MAFVGGKVVDRIFDKLDALSIVPYLPPHRPPSEIWPYLAVGLTSIWTISYLVHLAPPRSAGLPPTAKHPSAQLLCYALLPIALASPLWFWASLDLHSSTTQWTAWGNVIFTMMASALRWTFSPVRPAYHPLPRKVLFSRLRETTAFKVFNLPLTEFRLHGLTDHSPPYRSNQRSYFDALRSHFGFWVLRLFIFDTLTLGLHLLDPGNLGAIRSFGGPRRDWNTSMETIAWKTGVPRVIVPWAVTLQFIVVTCAGVALGHDQYTFLAVGSGIWADEEWPAVMNKPWMSTSLNELWGHKYHTYLQNVFRMLTLPIAFLPESQRIPRIFFGSALLHMFLLYPLTGIFSFRAHIIQYMSLALGCSLERAYFKRTGKRIGGWRGRLWMWAVLLASSYVGCREWYELGWAGIYRLDLKDGASPIVRLLAAAGIDGKEKTD